MHNQREYSTLLLELGAGDDFDFKDFTHLTLVIICPDLDVDQNKSVSVRIEGQVVTAGLWVPIAPAGVITLTDANPSDLIILSGVLLHAIRLNYIHTNQDPVPAVTANLKVA